MVGEDGFDPARHPFHIYIGATKAAAAHGLPVGKLADVVVIDLNRPNMQPRNSILSNIVYSGSKENVRLTMVNGRILYENGEFLIGQDPEEIYREANEFVKSLA